MRTSLFFHLNFQQSTTLNLLVSLLFTCIDIADLVNVFEVFLPQLLLYPNPEDPLNQEAGGLLMHDRNSYDQKVKGEFTNAFLNLH